MVNSETIRIRYEEVLENIQKSKKLHFDNSEPVRLVVVTKTHPLETISAAIAAGITEFGENYAEEAVEKIDVFRKNQNLTWHMIGHIQSRKANLIAKNFNFVHSVDSYKLAVRLDRFASDNDRILPVLLECNVSGEESKFGFSVHVRSTWEILAEEAVKISELTHLEIRGLMTMPPLCDNPEDNRSAFQMLRDLRNYLVKKVPSVHWKDLSMGTSNDYGVAVEEGASIVRVGSAILGSRSVPTNN